MSRYVPGHRPSTSRHRSRGAVVLLAVVAVVLMSCSKTTTSSPGASSTTRTTRGVTATAIKVGGIFSPVFFGGADIGAQARIDRANRDGGVFGRKIQLIGVSDSNNEQTVSLAIAGRLIRQDQVFALLPVAAANLGFSDLVKQERVPFFGYGSDPPFCGNPYGFGVTGCVTDPTGRITSDVAGLVTAAWFGGDSHKTAAVIGEDFDAARGGVKLVATSLESTGFMVVYAKTPVPAPPAAVGDYSPFVSELLKSDNGKPPEVIYEILTGADGIGLYQALRAAGYKGMVALPAYDPRVATSIKGAAVLTQFAPYESAAQLPRMQQMIADVRAVKRDQLLTIGLAAGYWSADMFISLLQKAGQNLSVERLLAASQGWSYGVPGVIGTSHWPQMHDAPVPCGSLSLAAAGSFVPKVPLTCGRLIAVK